MEAQTTVHEIVKPNILLLTARAQAGNGDELPLRRRNGVIVSPAGWLLTTHSLIDFSTTVKPESLRITANGSATGNKDIRLAIVDSNEHLDLLFLALPVGDYPHFVLPSVSPPTVVNKLYVSGYTDKDEFYSGSVGDLKPSDQTVDAALHGIGIGALGVLAGGPVYNSDGQLFGLVQGEDTRHEIIFLPIAYAAPLLVMVRMDAITTGQNDPLAERLGELEASIHELQTHVAFDPVIDVTKGRVLINYDKFLSEPAIEYIDVSVFAVNPPSLTPIGPGEPVRIARGNPDPADPTKGSFDATADLLAAIQNTKAVLPGTTGFKFRISGKLKDTEGPIPSVEIDRETPF